MRDRFEVVTAYLVLQGYCTLHTSGAAHRFARFADRSMIVIEPRPDGRLSVRSERLGVPCLVIRSHCTEPTLLTTVLEQVCFLDEVRS